MHRLCASLDAMLQGLICMLDFVAIASFLCLQLIILLASAVGLLGVTNRQVQSDKGVRSQSPKKKNGFRL